MHGATIRPPGGELPADVGELPRGELGIGRIRHGDGGRLTAHQGNRDRVHLLGHQSQGLITPRGHEHQAGGPRVGRAGCGGAAHLDVRLLVGAVPANRHQPVPAAVQINAVRVLREMGIRPARQRRDDRGLAAVRRHPDQLLDGAERAAGRGGFPERPGRTPHGHHPLPVGRPGGRDVHAAPVREVHRVAAGGPHLAQPAFILPPHGIGDPPAVGRPGGVMLGGGVSGEPPGIAAVGIRHPEMIHGGERHAPPVRGRHRIPDLPHHERGTVVHRVVEVHLGSQLEIEHHVEGDLRGGTAGDGNAPDPPAVRRDHAPGIRRERHPGQQIEGAAGLRVVVLHRVGQPALLARRQLPQDQARSLVVARAVDQPLAIGRQRGSETRAVARRAGIGLARLPIVHGELVLGQVGVVIPVARSPGEPHTTPVGTERRAHRLQPLGLLEELCARATLHMKEMQPRQVPAPEVAHPGDDVVPVRRPLR